jgi:hypothetical protein
VSEEEMEREEIAVDPEQATLDDDPEVELPENESSGEKLNGSPEEAMRGFLGESPWADEPRMGPVDKSYPGEPPVETVMHNSVTDFTRLPDGGMLLTFTPLIQVGPGNWAPMPPAVTTEFSVEAWEIFKERVAADGKLPERIRARNRIEVARDFSGPASKIH